MLTGLSILTKETILAELSPEVGSVGRATEAGVPRSRLMQANPWLYECGELHRDTWALRGIEYLRR